MNKKRHYIILCLFFCFSLTVFSGCGKEAGLSKNVELQEADVFKSSSSGDVYKYIDGKKRAFQAWGDFLKCGYTAENIKVISPEKVSKIPNDTVYQKCDK